MGLILHINKFNLSILLFLFTLTFAQMENWVYKYNGTGNSDDEANDLILGEDKNLYVTGFSTESGTMRDLTIIKLDTLGNEIHVYHYNGGFFSDIGYSIIYGDDGNIYAAGMRNTYYGILLALDTTLNVIWADSTLFSSCYYRLTKGDSNEVYVGGWLFEGSYESIMITKFFYDGTKAWSYYWSSPYAEVPYSIKFGLDKNVYITGTDYLDLQNADLITLSLTPTGELKWLYRYHSFSGTSAGRSLVYGEDNNIYIAGYCADTLNDWDFGVIALDTLGNENWVYRYDGAYHKNDVASAMAFGRDGNLYVAGYSCENSLLPDILVISLTPHGNERWIYRYDGPAGGSDYGTAIIYGSNNHIYVTGYSSGISSYDIVIICLDTLGNEKWIYRYDDPNSDKAYAIIGENEDIYLAGVSAGDFTVINVKDTTAVGNDEKNQKLISKDQISKLEVYPNPFNWTVSIKIHNSSTTFQGYSKLRTTLQIYDITGKLVKNFSVTTDRYPQFAIEWSGDDDSGRRLPAGVYFVSLESEGFKQVEKVVLLR